MHGWPSGHYICSHTQCHHSPRFYNEPHATSHLQMSLPVSFTPTDLVQICIFLVLFDKIVVPPLPFFCCSFMSSGYFFFCLSASAGFFLLFFLQSKHPVHCFSAHSSPPHTNCVESSGVSRWWVDGWDWDSQMQNSFQNRSCNLLLCPDSQSAI